MALNYTILYRGPLSGCNFHCPYCPFARGVDSPEVLFADRTALTRFTAWLATRPEQFSLFFIPRGEALIHPWYQEAIVRLTRLPQIHRVAIQTNLSCQLAWMEQCQTQRLGLWCSYHPTQIPRDEFLRQCTFLAERGIAHSVGIVGVREHFAEISSMRAALPVATYLWINAFKRDPEYYRPEEIAFLTEIDPLFPINLRPQRCHGEMCRCGSTVFYLDGNGVMRRCPFVEHPIGNIYDDDFTIVLPGDACPNDECRCHIGYAHLERVGFDRIFGDGLLERAPAKSLR